MAIKPIVSFVFATSTNYSVGPQIGNPTKIPPSDTANGVVPGDGIPAAWHNYMWNICGQWSGWLLAGTSAPDLSAHLIETDSNGWAEIGQLTLGGTATSLQSLIVSENTGATSAAAIFLNSSGGFGLTSTVNGSLAAARGVNTGTGPALEGVALGTNNVGVKGSGAGTGAGVTGTGGATGAGVSGTGGATGGVGVSGTGTGFGVGVSGTGGPSAAQAILGTGATVSQIGVQRSTAAAATSAASGVVGSALGDAVGVRATAANGYGVLAQSDTSSPTRAPLRKVSQDADPTTAASGDETHRSDLDIPRVYCDSRWQSPWTTESGHAHGLSSPRITLALNDDDAVYVTLVTTTLLSPYEPRFAGGSLLLFASARFGDASTSNHHYFIDVQILDSTAGAVVYEQTICTGPADIDATVDGEACVGWSIAVPYTIPAAGARVFALRFKPTTSNGFNAVANQCSLQVMGVFG